VLGKKNDTFFFLLLFQWNDCTIFEFDNILHFRFYGFKEVLWHFKEVLSKLYLCISYNPFTDFLSMDLKKKGLKS